MESLARGALRAVCASKAAVVAGETDRECIIVESG